MSKTNASTGQIPFPHAKPSKALEAEDSFMQTHGGFGARVIFETAEMLGKAFGLFFTNRAVRSITQNRKGLRIAASHGLLRQTQGVPHGSAANPPEY